MKKIPLVFLIIMLSFSFCFALSQEPQKEFSFSIEVPQKVQSNIPFKAIIKVIDAQNNILKDYNLWGKGVEVTSEPAGVIIPSYINPSMFKAGEAIVEFVYNKEGDITLSFKEAEKIKKPVEGEPEPAVKPIASAYKINSYDEIEISVWQADGLTQTVTVSPDGNIFFPLIGELHIEGLTLKQLADTITEKIAEYVISPQVAVILKRLGGRRILILGEVKFPGVYNLQEMNVIEAVTAAGGFTEDAVTTKVVIMRGGLHRKPDVKFVNVIKLIRSGKFTKEAYLQPNDVIFVSRNLISDYRYFITNVLPNASPDKAIEYRTHKMW
ncbi:MAG: polysaccharide export protein [Candidatus Omnitrophica bacterium]|nr:polysaccharide export protein [Candidatus Omnitrophota bacterium]